MNFSKRAILGGVYLRGAFIGVLGYAQKHEKILSQCCYIRNKCHEQASFNVDINTLCLDRTKEAFLWHRMKDLTVLKYSPVSF